MPLAPFTLVDQDAKPFTLDGFEGRWTLLVFGYTHCPDVCPITLAQVSDTRALLRHEAPALALGTVFVSIDPQRDTPSRIAPYVAAFDEALIGLTGPADDIAAFAAQFSVKYSVTEGSDGDYFLDHTSSVALLTPRAELRALFSVPLRPERLAKDLLAIVAEDAGAHDAGTPERGR
jgi:protein SCO1/2